MNMMSHTEIASELGISRERVRQIENNALRKLKMKPGVLSSFKNYCPAHTENYWERMDE